MGHEMKPKSADCHSWRMFWLLQAWAIPFLGLFATLITWRGPQGTLLPFNRALVVGLLAALGAFVIGLIHRLISKRNNGLGFFYIMSLTVPINNAANVNRPLSHLALMQAASWLVLAVMVVLTDTFLWARNRTKSKPRASPMADAEIDGRPIT
jgi:hypothetical protein